jgi:hypothetical protein
MHVSSGGWLAVMELHMYEVVYTPRGVSEICASLPVFPCMQLTPDLVENGFSGRLLVVVVLSRPTPIHTLSGPDYDLGVHVHSIA